MPKKKILVSACLLGETCRFDGCSCTNDDLINDLDPVELIPVCPEEMGGLNTPRPRARIVGEQEDADGHDVLKGDAKVLTHEGKDVTSEYLKGGERTLKVAEASGAGLAILKSNSPSCGCGKIFTQDFESLIQGDGTTTAILKKAGIKVVDELEYRDALDEYRNK